MGNILHLPATTCRLALLLLACATVTVRPAVAAPRDTLPLTEDWSFHLGADADGSAPSGETSGWPVIRPPHTWNAADGADGGGDYRRDAGWYVRRFRIDAAWAQRRIFLQFDGANRNTTVFLNGREIGTHAGGYARFRFDLTGHLRAGENILAVRVSNAADGLAPVSADFTFFGGLYRGVQLLALDPVHIDVMDHAADGVYVTPGQVSAARADFSVAVAVRNESARGEPVVIRTVIRDAQGAAVATREETREIAARGAVRCEQSFTLERPRLWNGRADPHQYAADVTVLVDGEVRDRLAPRFGLRSFRVDADQGFFLNGVPLDLHGVSRHQDRAGKGWAISPEDERQDFAIVEEIGATALRVAHYPQSALWFDLADERGLVVWAELPVVNEVLATAAYEDNARQQLRELIRQNYNRPAICFWGVGNETREAGEVTGGPQRPNGPASDRLIAALTQLAREEDPTRLSTYASHHRATDSRNFHTDVVGFNKYFGWYGGTVEEFAGWVDDVHRRYPALRFAMSEYGAGANIRQHEAAPAKPAADGAWHPEEYQARYHEVCWEAMRTRPYLWGKFVWNLFDFASDIRTEGDAPGLNDKGLVTYDRQTRKDAFYWYQANWSAAPVLHLNGRRFTDRPAGPAEIKAYANTPQVELFLNGASCGTVASDSRVFRWNVVLIPGKNTLVARAKSGAIELTDDYTLTCPPRAQP